MVHTIRFLVLLFATGLVSSECLADIAPQPSPLPKPAVVAPLRIVADAPPSTDGTPAAKIIIPESVLKDLLEEQSKQSAGSLSSSSGPSTVIAFIALTTAALSLLFANKVASKRSLGALIFILGSIAAGAVAVYSLQSPQPSPAKPNNSEEPSEISFEIQPDGHEVMLLLPPGTDASQ